MISTTNLVILLGCLGFFSVRACKLGIWQALLNLLGLLVAYIICIVVGPLLVKFVQPTSIQDGIAVVVTLSVLFFTVLGLISFLPKFCFPFLNKVNRNQRIAGAAFGALNGCLVAFLLIWMASLIGAFLNKNSDDEHQRDSLNQFISDFFSRTVQFAMAGDGDDLKSNVVSVAISNPQQVSQAFSQISQPLFWQDKSVQAKMLQADVDGLVGHARFQSLVSQPAVANIIEKSIPSGGSKEQMQRYLASELSVIYRRVHALKNDPRFIDMMADPEVREELEAKNPNPIALLRNPKIQALVELVFEDEQVAVSALSADELVVATPTKKPAIYKWTDQYGRVLYTDFSATPEEHRAIENEVK